MEKETKYNCNCNKKNRFLDIIPFVFKWENVYNSKGEVVSEKVPGDDGLETKYGIDKRSHPKEDIRNLTEKRATEIYKAEYWDKYDCEKLPYPLGECYFDACVNCGSGQANKFLALADGNAEKFNRERVGFYERLAKQKPRMKKFLKGWKNRVAALNRFFGIGC